MIPVGLGILWIVEGLLNLLLDWALDWRPGGLLYYVIFVGGGLVLIVVMVFAARFVCITTRLLAPRTMVGLLLVAAAYVTAQAIRFSQLGAALDSVWQNALLKVEFVIIVAIVFALAYRSESARQQVEPQPNEEGIQ